MNHRVLPVLKIALTCLLVTGLITACGGPSDGPKTNGSNGSGAKPVTGQSNPSNATSNTATTSSAASGSVNSGQPTAPAQSAAPAQPNAPASNPNDGSAVQSSAGGNAAVSNADAKGDAADQALTDLENSLNSVDTIDDLK